MTLSDVCSARVLDIVEDFPFLCEGTKRDTMGPTPATCVKFNHTVGYSGRLLHACQHLPFTGLG